MRRKTEEAEKVERRDEIYVRRQCRNCRNITGGFTSSNLSERRTCRAKVNDGEGVCDGDMDEIFRGRV
jgi:hypothetical protein